MITSTTFKSLNMRCKIMGAMRRAMIRKVPQIIYNRKGAPFMTVERVTVGQRCFRFLTNKADVTESVYKGLRV